MTIDYPPIRDLSDIEAIEKIPLEKQIFSSDVNDWVRRGLDLDRVLKHATCLALSEGVEFDLESRRIRVHVQPVLAEHGDHICRQLVVRCVSSR